MRIYAVACATILFVWAMPATACQFAPSAAQKLEGSDVVFTGKVKDYSTCAIRKAGGNGFVEFEPVTIYKGAKKVSYKLDSSWYCNDYVKGGKYLVYAKYNNAYVLEPTNTACPGSVTRIRLRFFDWVDFQYFMIVRLRMFHLLENFPNPNDDIDYLEKTLQTVHHD